MSRAEVVSNIVALTLSIAAIGLGAWDLLDRYADDPQPVAAYEVQR
ncbi:hypothetical protein [Paracoccus yeei]